MSDRLGPLAIKLRYIIAPTLALSIAVAGVYSLLNWLLVARNGLVPLDEDVANIWLPLAVSWVLVIVFVQPGLRLMKDDAKEHLPYIYHFAAVAVLAVPTILAQRYISAASGGVTHLEQQDEIGSAGATKYYLIDVLCLSREEAIVQPAVRVTGKNNRTLNFDLYALLPGCEQGSSSTRIWITQKFHDSHSNSLSAPEREAMLTDFVRRSTGELTRLDSEPFRYFARLGHNSDRKHLPRRSDATASTSMLHRRSFSFRIWKPMRIGQETDCRGHSPPLASLRLHGSPPYCSDRSTPRDGSSAREEVYRMLR